MSKTIDIELVRHVARLSRIELTEQELEVFSRQLASILEHFDKLQELDTANVEPMAHAVELSNVFGEDEQGLSLATDEALANAPDRHEDLFKVPKVIGDSQ